MIWVSLHAGIQKVLSEGVKLGQRFFFCFFFIVDNGREDPSTTISPPKNAVLLTPFSLFYVIRHALEECKVPEYEVSTLSLSSVLCVCSV